MSQPKSPSAYPPEMLQALHRAIDHGEFVIPTLTPSRLRFAFYGLAKALKTAEHPDAWVSSQVKITLGDGFLTLTARGADPLILDIKSALGAPPNQPSAVEEAEASLMRILG